MVEATRLRQPNMEWTQLTLLLGRLLLGGYFLHAGYSHFRHRKMMAGYAASKGVPLALPAILGTGILLALGGLSLLTGYQPLIGLAFLTLFLVGVTPKIHDYWNVKDPMARMGERANFLKNTALLGAVLMLTIVPTPWPYAL
jgi:putative oxidoreductase